jgi:Sulfotransferase domain
MSTPLLQKDYRAVGHKMLEKYLPTPVYRQYMRLLNGKGGLPDFFVLGAQKGGTTSLYHILVKLPGIIPAVRKEIEFFNDPDRRKLGVNWYMEHFPSPQIKQKTAKKIGFEPVTGEGTTLLNHPLAPKLLKEIAPDVKFIVLLREPASRAYSHYQHNIERGSETRSFEQALAEEDEAVKFDMEELKKDQSYPAHSLRAHSYKQRGRYVENLSRWFEQFPCENFYIEESRRFFKQQDEILREIQEFIGVPPSPVVQKKRVYNKGNYRSEAPEQSLNKLKEYFYPYNKALYELLGRRFDW